MSFEAYHQVEHDIQTCIRPGKSLTFTFSGDGYRDAKRLFVTGETNISPYWKTEPDYQMLYRRIDDSLRSDMANHDRFCLDLSGGPCSYPKIAFKKLVSPFRTPMFYLNDCTNRWSFGISAKATDLKVYGYLRVCVEVRYRKEGVDPHSTVPTPDEVFTIDIPAGSYDWQSLCREIEIDTYNVANVGYYAEGENYEGEIYLEAPHFTSESGHNVVGQFLPHSEDRPTFNWMGQNLSRVEWIGLKVDLNGQTVFDGEIFERCHRFSEAEIPLPSGSIRDGENTITFTCTSDYRDAAGYVMGEWGLITEQASAVIAVPECVTAGKPFAVCVEGRKGDTITFSSDSVTLVGDAVLQNDGLNALHLVCHTPANHLTFTLNGEEYTIPRCVEREDDGVLTGTGDLLYLSVKEEDFTNYLKWYLSQHVGNMLTIRPSYRWNGTRTMNSELYRQTAAFLDSMDLCYAHMLDGRELPGCNQNPTVDELDTPHFLGRQKHELDGQYVYWGDRDITGKISEQMFYDLYLRMGRDYAERMHDRYIPENVQYTAGRQLIFRSPVVPSDMKGAAEVFIQSLRNVRKGTPRHTGPSTLFKYFYQAGFPWVGAELMYSPTELTISALRGANRVYGGRTGGHLAVQWSTSPHDTESRYRRYRLALFISYIQGLDEINTEEGLWRLEEYYHYHHRFSAACENHTRQQQDLYRYIASHTRRGNFYTPIAFLSGRYDGWRGFGRHATWGIGHFGFGDMEKAWDLLTCFYPKSVLNVLYVHNCPDRELGYYSGTPNGNVDILPIEAQDFSAYRLLIAAGYNKAEAEDLPKLRDFVTQGGTLLIGWPQLSVTVDRAKLLAYDHEYIDGKERRFVSDTYGSHPVSICEEVEYDDVLIYTDSHKPLVVIKRMGDGCVYFVNAKEYAGSAAVDLAYRETIEKLTADCLSQETIYAKGDRNVQLAVYEREEGSREIYFIATDWHKPNPDGFGTLVLGTDEYQIPVPWGQLVKIVARDDCALYPESDENEVISLNGSAARVQGVGQAVFILCRDGERKRIAVDFTEQSVREIRLAE